MRHLAEGRASRSIPWPCIHEFFAIVTHPRIYDPPTPLIRALDQVDAWLESPSLALLSEGRDHWRVLRRRVRAGRVVGPQVHAARAAARCAAHGGRERAPRRGERHGARLASPRIGGW